MPIRRRPQRTHPPEADETGGRIPDGRTARRDRNRLLVLDAALELFAAGDLNPSPEAVAQRSGVSLRSVYRYVQDREDLINAAIERHVEKIGPLFVLDPVGEGPFDDRVLAFVAARIRLYEAVAPTARAALLRTKVSSTPGSAIIRERLAARRGMFRVQLARQFAPELATFGPDADAIMAAADGLTQIEAIDWFVTDAGYTLEQTGQAMATGLRRLLGPGRN